jgi:acyl-CoA thioesterase
MAEEEVNEKIEHSAEMIEDEANEDHISASLNTHVDIDNHTCGQLEELRTGYAKVTLHTSEEMGVDRYGLVHGGYIFSAADFASMAAVNDPNVVLASATTQFLAPVRVGDEVMVEAKMRHKEGRKRTVLVTAYVHDIKVFEGSFSTVILDRHILKVNLSEAGNTTKEG